MDKDLIQMYQSLLQNRIDDELGGVIRRTDASIYYLYPSYTMPRFAKPQTVYLASDKRLNKDGYVKGASYDYSDRLFQWDWSKAADAWKSIKEQTFVNNSAEQHEAYLKAYHGKPLRLVHIMAGYNVSNGHPYQVYGVIYEA